MELLAQRLKKENINIILSSKWHRASQTAEKVSKNLKVKLKLFEGIHEKEQHPGLYGAKLSSEIHQRYIEEIQQYLLSEQAQQFSPQFFDDLIYQCIPL